MLVTAWNPGGGQVTSPTTEVRGREVTITDAHSADDTRMLARTIEFISVQKKKKMCRLSLVFALFVSASQCSFVWVTSDLAPVSAPPADGASLAWATFNNSISQTGWGFLSVGTNQSLEWSAAKVSRAAGIAEGFLTAELMALQSYNIWAGQGPCYGFPAPLCDFVTDFYTKNDEWVRGQIAENPDDEYWTAVSLVMEQFEGVWQGQNLFAAASGGRVRSLTRLDVWLLNSADDVSDIAQAFPFEGSGLARPSPFRDRCSAFIRLLPDGVHVFHNTWSSFHTMLRVFKTYTLPGGFDVSFSSYPGYVTSTDDYYELPGPGLVAVETTNTVWNSKLYALLTPKSVLEWVRTLAANRLAKTPQQWVTIASRHNSGTYNNGWMVVSVVGELNFWYSEQIPGFVEMRDLTEHLRQKGYFASYNVPFFATIFNESGWPAQVAKYGRYGNEMTYDECGRARIFQARANGTIDTEGMKFLARYNDFAHDPISKCPCLPNPPGADAGIAIAARHDLNPPTGHFPEPFGAGRAAGAIDAKVTSPSLFAARKRWLISGPTSQGQPPFDWTTTLFPDRHEGQPERWEFPWILHEN
jgi:hypothetical protein